jgi:hypothetical protein
MSIQPLQQTAPAIPLSRVPSLSTRPPLLSWVVRRSEQRCSEMIFDE